MGGGREGGKRRVCREGGRERKWGMCRVGGNSIAGREARSKMKWEREGERVYIEVEKGGREG